MSIVTFALTIGLALAAGLLSRRGSKSDIDDYLVGGRSFGPILVFILGAGEAYSIGTLIGFPGGVYAHGSSYGVWFIAYILLAYAVGYFFTPYLWRAGKLYGAMTLPDVAGRHFRSRGLELTVAISSVIFLIPWGQLQLAGLQVALSGLGISIDPTVAVFAGAGLALVFLLLSGLRAPAFVSYVKDAALLLGAVLIGMAAIAKSGGTEMLFGAAHAAGAGKDTHFTVTGSSLTFVLTTIVFQSVGFFIFPFVVQAVLASKSEATLKRVARFNPLYMLMYVFLVAAAFAAISQVPGKLEGAKSNEALLILSRIVLPDWVTGIVAGGAALCAIVVLCGSALGIGSIVSRNIVPGIPESRQKGWVRGVIVAYLAISLILTMAAPQLLLTLVNTAYYGVTQAAVIFAAMVFGWKVRPVGLATGLIVGDLLVLWLYLDSHGPISSWLAQSGINIGAAALVVNALLVVISRMVWPATDPVPGLRQVMPGRRSPVQARPIGENAL
ncbi:sodium:solute symporter [Tsukamurella pulmonis]|uniref:Solute:Na+ symporter, SSS family n=1 Tax=Tsukamurella pulmonis TaxID=47312 RepID=A0A1H1DC18_9ACTN|nr:sodium:solute symporter [Tsukamurella pulmonis]KXO92395.1 sodium:solute symporter [Tsukamurella pulmonis]BDD83462.1 sodium:solute symporter [Tsukamurella pulmonis]SDQ73982.1 solute:Na+ symporter, SSS family [Tsukamurella pulmonis]SUP22222.1 Propionate transporter [Tsukamurella pulmonis]